MAVSRRSFLKSAAAATAVSAVGSTVNTVLGETNTIMASNTSPNKWRGRVAINFNKSAVTDPATKKCDSTIVKKMVDDAIMALSEKSAVGDAWKEIFPSDTLSSTSKIAIKTNFYALPISPPPEALLGIVEGLRQMTFDGQKFTGEITIFEGNAPNSFAQAKYDETAFKSADVTLKFCSAGDYTQGADPATGESKYVSLLDKADFLINVFSARGHNDYTEGVSLGFKSHYGTYINQPMGTIHSTSSPGYKERVRNLQCTGVISKKQVLSVSCAFYCNNEGDSMGSTSTKPFTTYVKTMDPEATCLSPSTLIMSTDAISCEMQAIKLLRLNKGKSYGVNDMPKYLRASAGINGALSDNTYDIGEIDESKMDIRKIINGTLVTTGVTPSIGHTALSISPTTLKATVLHSQGLTYFEFKLPSRLQGSVATLSVLDLQGRQLFAKSITVQGVRNHFTWDQRKSSGLKTGSGKYIATLKGNGIVCSDAFIL